MEIKTVVKRLDNADEFDKEVNFELGCGFVLKKRGLITPKVSQEGYYIHTMLYAELVKDEKEEPVKDEKEEAKEFDPVEAVTGLANLCGHIISTEGMCERKCPVYGTCYRYFRGQPRNWEDLEK